MTTPHDTQTTTALDALLAQGGLDRSSVLFREAMRDALVPTETPGVFRLAANPSSSEAVVDVYGNSYVVVAEQIGPGLTFAESSRPNWQETMEMRALKEGHAALDAIEVEVSIEDILRQGGLIYPVESVTVERAWFCTLPAGSVNVRAV